MSPLYVAKLPAVVYVCPYASLMSTSNAYLKNRRIYGDTGADAVTNIFNLPPNIPLTLL